jgi:hypothetical protein
MTRKLHPTGPDIRDMFATNEAAELLGLGHHRQIRAVTLAPTLDQATAQFELAGLGRYSARMRRQMGGSIDLLIEAGVLVDDTAVLAWYAPVHGEPVGRFSAEGNSVVGRWRYVDIHTGVVFEKAAP